MKQFIFPHFSAARFPPGRNKTRCSFYCWHSWGVNRRILWPHSHHAWGNNSGISWPTGKHLAVSRYHINPSFRFNHSSTISWGLERVVYFSSEYGQVLCKPVLGRKFPGLNGENNSNNNGFHSARNGETNTEFPKEIILMVPRTWWTYCEVRNLLSVANN